MNLPEVVYDIGQTFLMTLHLSPELQKEYKKENMIVEAVYLGIWTNEVISKESIKVIAMAKDTTSHHVVKFNGELWVNDLCGVHGKVKGWEKTVINLEEELAVSSHDQEEVKEEELPDGPRPSVRRLFHGSRGWNIDGIKSARIKGDGPIQICEITGDELFYIEGDTGFRAELRASFVCQDCKRLLGEKVMQMNGSHRSQYPVVYVGAYCIECSPNKKE